MDLLYPEIGLIAWTVFTFVTLIFIILATFKIITSKNIRVSEKIIWLIIVLILPFFGAIFYLFNEKYILSK